MKNDMIEKKYEVTSKDISELKQTVNEQLGRFNSIALKVKGSKRLFPLLIFTFIILIFICKFEWSGLIFSTSLLIGLLILICRDYKLKKTYVFELIALNFVRQIYIDAKESYYDPTVIHRFPSDSILKEGLE